MSTVAIPAPRARPSVLARAWSFVRRHTLTVYSLLFFAYLLLPIGVVVAFSFNNPKGRFNYTWQGFTWKNWSHWDAIPDLRSALVLSLEIALIASIVATALGTLVALALVRYGFRGRGFTNFLIFLPMSTPEIVMGSSLLALFLNDQNTIQLGFWTIFIAHVMFIISFVVVTVKARLIGFDRHLEEAAMDLGCPPGRTFLVITLPLIWPAVAAGWMLAFTLSLDDLVIASFTTGPGATTLPMRIYSQVRLGVKPEINAVCTIMIAVVATALVVSSLLSKQTRANS
jgi:ABC-type spermidine/putrescine transport system permease subunit II